MTLPPIIIFYGKKFFSIEDMPILRKMYVKFSRFIKFILSSDSMAIMITNTNKMALLIILTAYSMLLGAQGGRASERYVKFSQNLIPDSEFVTNLREKLNKKPRNKYFNQGEYISRLQPGQLIQKAAIDNYNIRSNNLELFVTEFRWDNKLLDSLQNDNETLAKTEFIKNMIMVTIDSAEYQGLDWRKTNHKQTNQSGWITFIDINNLEPGQHKISVDKVIWNYSTGNIEFFKEWNKFEFYKE